MAKSRHSKLPGRAAFLREVISGVHSPRWGVLCSALPTVGVFFSGVGDGWGAIWGVELGLLLVDAAKGLFKAAFYHYSCRICGSQLAKHITVCVMFVHSREWMSFLLC